MGNRIKKVLRLGFIFVRTAYFGFLFIAGYGATQIAIEDLTSNTRKLAKAEKLYKEKDYEDAYELFKYLVDNQQDSPNQYINSVSVYYIGRMYEAGDYLGKDVNEAIRWFKQSYDSRATRKLGYLYSADDSEVKDISKAVKLFKSECNETSSHEYSCIMLASFYIKGRGVSRNYARASRLLDKIYISTDDDYNEDMLYNVGLAAIEAGQYQIARKAFDKVTAFTGSKSSDGEAYNDLANLYADGNGVSQDFDTAIRYYVKGANLNSHAAMFNLARFLAYGWYVPRDVNKAISLAKSAAKSDRSDIQHQVKLLLSDIENHRELLASMPPNLPYERDYGWYRRNQNASRYTYSNQPDPRDAATQFGYDMMGVR